MSAKDITCVRKLSYSYTLHLMPHKDAEHLDKYLHCHICCKIYLIYIPYSIRDFLLVLCFTIYKTVRACVGVYIHDFRCLLDRFRSLLGLVEGAAAVRTHASRISSSPVSYISESVVAQPRDDCDLESTTTKLKEY